MRRAPCAGLLAVALWSTAGWGDTLKVGASQTYATPCAAAAAAQDGDTIEIDAGTYAGDFCAWTRNSLTIRGVGGRAHLDAAGHTISNGKAIWVIQGSNTTIEGIEFSGATVPDQNGAGIRQEGAGLTVRDCSFHDNDDGILAGDNADSDIVIESTEFVDNGYGDGQSHNFYINHVRSFTLRACWSHRARIGHLVKSRALVNHILYNRLTDETGTASYEIDLPNGGTAYVIGNLIQQSASTDNPTLLTYGEEGLTNPDTHLYVVNNTFVNDRASGGTFVRVASGAATAVVTNNLFVGPGTVLDGPGTEQASVTTDAPGLVDRAGYDYHLVAGSPAVNAGVDPGTAGSESLRPLVQYVHPLQLEGRGVVGAYDVGAYELGGGIPGDGGTPADGGPSDAGRSDAGGQADSPVREDGGPDGLGDSGSCGCRAASAAGPGGLALLGLVLLASRRRV
jgi:MYXO-CTERM domain-containing protein